MYVTDKGRVMMPERIRDAAGVMAGSEVWPRHVNRVVRIVDSSCVLPLPPPQFGGQHECKSTASAMPGPNGVLLCKATRSHGVATMASRRGAGQAILPDSVPGIGAGTRCQESAPLIVSSFGDTVMFRENNGLKSLSVQGPAQAAESSPGSERRTRRARAQTGGGFP